MKTSVKFLGGPLNGFSKKLDRLCPLYEQMEINHEMDWEDPLDTQTVYCRSRYKGRKMAGGGFQYVYEGTEVTRETTREKLARLMEWLGS